MTGAPRVMVIVAAREVTGPSKGIFQLMEAFKGSGISLSLYNFDVEGAPSGRFVDAAREAGTDLHMFRQKGKSYLSILRQARREALEKKFKIVQTHGYKPAMIGLYLKYACRLKWVCFMHGTTNESFRVRFYNLFDRVVQRFADRVVLMTASQRAKIIGGADEERVRVIHNAVDPDRPASFSPNGGDPAEKAGIPAAARILSVVGRLSPEKGVDEFLRAFASVSAGHPDVHAAIVGEGPERRNLEALARQLGLSERVHFTGYTPYSGDFISRSEMLIIPSRSEGIPNVALEALALGRPVVATRVGGVPEVIMDGLDGLLVPPEDPKALASAIDSLLKDRVLSARLAKAGRKRVREHFSLAQMVAHTHDAYLNVTK